MSGVLLPHQTQLITSLQNRVHDNRYVIVMGASGCGKSHTFQHLHRKFFDYGFEISMLFDGEYYSEDRDYSPFKKALYSTQSSYIQHIKKGSAEALKGIPYAGDFLSYATSSLSNRDMNVDINVFNEEEQVIVSEIKRISKNQKTCIICDNIHWWDNRSFKLLLMLLESNSTLSGKGFQGIYFVLSITENQESLNDELTRRLISLTKSEAIVSVPIFSLNDFRISIKDSTDKTLLESQIELLYNLINGHLKVYYEIINELNSNTFDFRREKDTTQLSYLSDILDRRLKDCGATGEQILQVLEYASIIGMSFPVEEIEAITNYSRTRLKRIIEDSSSLRLTETTQTPNYYKFAHEIIREIFISKVDSQDLDHYAILAECLREIKPSQYLRRAKYLMRSLNTETASVLYCLDMVMQLRVYNDISESVKCEVENILGEDLKEYIQHMSDAYSYFHMQKYDDTLNTLNKISNFYQTELLAERDMLTLACYSKKLATDDVICTIDKLESIRNSTELKNEKEMRERLGHILVTACAHTGEISKARKIEEDVAKSILPRRNIDEAANDRMHIIMRNANAIHGIDISPSHVKRALNFFGKASGNGTHRNIRQYYTSIINYSAVLTMDGKFEEAHTQALEGLKLERENGDILFPRPQILRSNFILAGVLTKRIEPREAIDMYNDILSYLPKGIMAEKLFYTSNQSVLYALINQPKRAHDILSSEALNHDIPHDKEGLYKYHVTTNCAIYNHLTGNTDDAIQNLEEQSHSLKKLVNGSYFFKKNELLIEVMKNHYTTDGLQWLDVVHLLNDSFQGTPWNYFGLGYALIALCDWGI